MRGAGKYYFLFPSYMLQIPFNIEVLILVKNVTYQFDTVKIWTLEVLLQPDSNQTTYHNLWKQFC